jgi:hypothetical protein
VFCKIIFVYLFFRLLDEQRFPNIELFLQHFNKSDDSFLFVFVLLLKTFSIEELWDMIQDLLEPESTSRSSRQKRINRLSNLESAKTSKQESLLTKPLAGWITGEELLDELTKLIPNSK